MPQGINTPVTKSPALQVATVLFMLALIALMLAL